MVLRVWKFENGINSIIVKGNHSHMVFLDTLLHADAVTDVSKLPWHKCLKEQQSKNSHLYNLPMSLFPTVDYVKIVTELMVGLGNITEEWNLPDICI